MILTVSCPSCSTSFPVDPAKIPPEGVRAQCNVCPEIFDIDRPSEAPQEALSAAEATPDPIETTESVEIGAVDLPPLEGSFETDESTVTGNEPTAADTVPSTDDDFAAIDMSVGVGPLDTGGPTADVVEAEATPLPDAPIEVAEPVEAAEPVEVVKPVEPPAAPSPESVESATPIRFGRRSPEDKAKSLARSLVSDLVAYSPEKHKEALAAGTLQEVFSDEIEKSLKDYQEQVTPEVMAKGTFFNEALNSILAEGQSIFSVDG